ncbi:MAG TPA: IclR family transcriptional regulator [Pseudonocardiaceae bacterium]
MTEASRYSAPAVEKAFAVLELISHHRDGLRMVDVVEQLALPRTSTFVLLRSLERMGYLVSDSGNRYRLTLKLFGLGMRAMNQSDIVAVARPHLDRLVERTGLTAHLASLERGDAVYLARIDAPGLVRFDTHVGKRTPAHLTAVGKAILAHLSAAQFDAVVPVLDLSSGTPRAMHTAAALQRELAKIRKAGYAVEDGEEVEGVRCLAAPVRRDGESVLASVGVIQLRSLLGDDRLADVAATVIDTARAIAQEVTRGAGVA